MCTEISTASTTRLRTLQPAASTSVSAASIDTSSCSTLIVGHPSIRRDDEMAKRTEFEPLLASPSHEIHYTSDRSNDNSMMNNSIHLEIDPEVIQPSSSMSMNIEVDESLNSFEDDDRSLLIADKPTSIRTQSEHVYLFNFLALLFVFVNMTLNLTVLAIIHERVPMKEPHLPDIGFDLFPDNRRFLDVAEYFIVVQMVGIFILLFFHKHRSIILRRICIIMGVIYFFRAISMASTQLPLASRNYQCSPQLKNSSETANISSFEFIEIIASRVFYMSIGMGLSINGHHAYCGDYIFSGHTVILVLVYLTFQEYLMPRRRTILWKVFQLSQFSMTVISVICIIIARGHYLIDIIVAYYFVTRTFYIYHSLCNSTSTFLKSPSNYFTRLWWWPVFLYFENIKYNNTTYTAKNDEVYQVQRHFEWPLPWPRGLGRRKNRTQVA